MTLTDDIMARATTWGRKDGTRTMYPLLYTARSDIIPSNAWIWDEDGDYMGTATIAELAQLIADWGLSPMPNYRD